MTENNNYDKVEGKIVDAVLTVADEEDITPIIGWVTNNSGNPHEIYIYKENDTNTHWVVEITAYQPHVPVKKESEEKARQYAKEQLN